MAGQAGNAGEFWALVFRNTRYVSEFELAVHRSSKVACIMSPFGLNAISIAIA